MKKVTEENRLLKSELKDLKAKVQIYKKMEMRVERKWISVRRSILPVPALQIPS